MNKNSILYVYILSVFDYYPLLFSNVNNGSSIVPYGTIGFSGNLDIILSDFSTGYSTGIKRGTKVQRVSKMKKESRRKGKSNVEEK